MAPEEEVAVRWMRGRRRVARVVGVRVGVGGRCGMRVLRIWRAVVLGRCARVVMVGVSRRRM